MTLVWHKAKKSNSIETYEGKLVLYFLGQYARSRLPWFVAGYSGEKRIILLSLLCAPSQEQGVSAKISATRKWHVKCKEGRRYRSDEVIISTKRKKTQTFKQTITNVAKQYNKADLYLDLVTD